MSSVATVGLFSLIYMLFILALIGFVIWFMFQLITTQREKVQALKEISAQLRARNQSNHL